MSLRETEPQPIKLKKKAVKQDAKHPFTAKIERKAEYVDYRVSEYFQTHGIPNPADLTAITRTLTAVFSGNYPRENSRNKPSKRFRPKK